jgi:hypothetical protein
MPQFFIHLVDGPTSVMDEEGYEFADIEDARREAVESARDLMASNLRDGKPLGLHRSFRIMDDSGALLDEVTFDDAVPRTADEQR